MIDETFEQMMTPNNRCEIYHKGESILVYGSSTGVGLTIDDRVKGKILTIIITPSKHPRIKNRRSYLVELEDGRILEFWKGQIFGLDTV